MSSFEDFENTQKEMYEEIIEILKEDPDLGQYTDQILDPIGYQAEYIRHQQQKIDKLEAANKVLVEAVEYSLEQKDQKYGMESVFDIHIFRQIKIFSILDEALTEVKRIMEGE